MPHKFVAAVFYELKLQFQQKKMGLVGEPQCNCKGHFRISKSNELCNWRAFPLNFNECNAMLWGNYQEMNLVEFCKYLPSDEYAQLKSCLWIAINIWQHPPMWKDIFKDGTCKISVHISISRWTLAETLMRGKGYFEAQLNEMLLLEKRSTFSPHW